MFAPSGSALKEAEESPRVYLWDLSHVFLCSKPPLHNIQHSICIGGFELIPKMLSRKEAFFQKRRNKGQTLGEPGLKPASIITSIFGTQSPA